METLRYRILGPLRLRHPDGQQPLKASKPRALLATLLLHPNRFVSTDLIADALWEGSPPRSATANIRTYVRALRASLQAAGLQAPIDTSAAGYSIQVGVDELDASLFESLLAEAGHLRDAGDAQQAARVYARAHDLWRGRPLEDLPLASAWEGSISRLEAQHRGLVDSLLDLRLAHGDPAGAVVLLNDRLAEDPYDERLWSRLVDALLEAGHTADARTAYDKAFRTLADELGVEPGPELALAGVRAEQRAARRPARPGPLRETTAEPVRPKVPSQLPLDVPDFSGRATELERLTELICGHDPVRPPVAVISGAPGTGKTALAVRLGHQVRDAFPDGQIYLDMRGATQPRDPGGALHDLLRSLDVPDSAVPADPERRSAALRSELASRRVLMIMDDVGSAGQVLPLLPGTGASALVITSRSRLTDLPGADSLGLDLLDTTQAIELLRRVAGDRPLDGDQDRAATDEIVAACGNLPLAIRIAASRLAQRPDLSAAELARRLRDESQRLDELSIGELAVRTSADLSYRALGAEEARLYRLIGHLALGEFTASSLDPVGAGTPTGAAIRRSLDRLIEANLVDVSSVTGREPRYRVHELVRLHAVTAGDAADRAQAVRDLTRVLTTALDRVRRAADDLGFEYFGVLDRTPAEFSPSPGPRMTVAEAREWCDAERAGMVPAVRAAAHNGLHDLAWRIAAAWGPYLDLRAGFDDWTESHRIGLASARACGDGRAEAIMLRNLGQIALYRDDWDPAYEQGTGANLLFDKVGDRLGVGVSSVQLGTWNRERGMPDAALGHFEAALHAFVDAGDINGEAVARSAIASIWIRRAEPAEAVRQLTAAFRLAAELGDPHREAKIRRRIAELRESQQQHGQAVRQLSAALAIFVRIGDVHCASYTRVSLGQAQLALGDDAAARRMFLEALEIGHRLGDRSVEAQASYQLGLLHRQAGHQDPARRYLGRAQRLWNSSRTTRVPPTPPGSSPPSDLASEEPRAIALASSDARNVLALYGGERAWPWRPCRGTRRGRPRPGGDVRDGAARSQRNEAVNPRDAEAALGWELERVGSTAWRGWSLKFQRLAFGYAHDSGWPDSASAVHWLAAHDLLHGGEPPRGALVWCRLGDETRVGCSLGGGKLIGPLPDGPVVIADLSVLSSECYWSAPHFPFAH